MRRLGAAEAPCVRDILAEHDGRWAHAEGCCARRGRRGRWRACTRDPTRAVFRIKGRLAHPGATDEQLVCNGQRRRALPSHIESHEESDKGREARGGWVWVWVWVGRGGREGGAACTEERALVMEHGMCEEGNAHIESA